MMTESKAKPKAKGTSLARKPSKSNTTSKSRAQSGANARQGADAKRANGKATRGRIERRSRSVGDWRPETLAEVRRLIHKADPDILEERKWIKPSNPMGVPVWSHAGIVCTGETYKHVVKLTFARGASLQDPRQLFNSSLEGNTRRAIDIREGETLNAAAFKALIQAAVAENLRTSAPKSKSPTSVAATSKPAPQEPKSSNATTKRNSDSGTVVLLSGGNPQIAKGDGEAPVQKYIAAMPGWKRDLGRRLDALIMKHAPHVRKAVKWNSPFYGIEGQGWFLSFHVFTRYVKVTFFSGTSLQPIPSGGTPKSKDVRWIDVREDDQFDEAQMAKWIKQAAALPGWAP